MIYCLIIISIKMNKLFKKKFYIDLNIGIKELDIIFERFITLNSKDLSDEDYIELEQILDIPDTELFDIILKKKIPPANLKNSVLKKF